MKALVKRERKPGLWLEEVPEPQVGINDVLIRVDRTGICGTDLHIYKWDEWAQRTIPTPMVVGHEFVGEVAEVGSNVKDFLPGRSRQRRGPRGLRALPQLPGGAASSCARTRSGIGVNRPGAFAEYIAVPMTNVWHHDDGIDRDVASIFDPFGNAVHTALSFPVLGEDVLVTGAGPIGIMAAAVVKHAGARFVVVTDVNEYRLDLARQMGATVALNVKSGRTLGDVQKELGMKEGFDVGLEMSGNPAGLREMVDNMCHGGKIAMLGIPSEAVPFDWNKVVFNMLTIKGIYGREMYETWYKMTVMLESGLDIKPAITHRFHYTEFEKGFEVMKSGKSGKVILGWR